MISQVSIHVHDLPRERLGCHISVQAGTTVDPRWRDFKAGRETGTVATLEADADLLGRASIELDVLKLAFTEGRIDPHRNAAPRVLEAEGMSVLLTLIQDVDSSVVAAFKIAGDRDAEDIPEAFELRKGPGSLIELDVDCALMGPARIDLDRFTLEAVPTASGVRLPLPEPWSVSASRERRKGVD